MFDLVVRRIKKPPDKTLNYKDVLRVYRVRSVGKANRVMVKRVKGVSESKSISVSCYKNCTCYYNCNRFAKVNYRHHPHESIPTRSNAK